MTGDYEREANAILADIPWREFDGTAPAYELRNPLPTATWRKLDTTPAFLTPSDKLRAWLAEALMALSYWVRP